MIKISQKIINESREFSSVDKNIAYYMQGRGSNPEHSIFKICELWSLCYLTKKKVITIND